MRTIAILSMVLAAGCGRDENKEPTAKPSGSAASAGAPSVAHGGMTISSRSPAAIGAFKKGLALDDSVRGAEAIQHFKQAIELDPEFALARAYHGMFLPVAEGQIEMDKAVALAATASEPEKLRIQAMVAARAGDAAKADATWVKLTQVAPEDWRAWLMVGMRAMMQRRFDAALSAFGKVRDAHPEVAIVWNHLAYTHAAREEWDQAIAAARKQTELLPKEPNPQDTYAEMLLLSGKFADADVAYQRAVQLEPKFAIAWYGAALARAHQGNHAGALEALSRGRDASQFGPERGEADLQMAFVRAADGKLDEALKTLQRMESDPALAGYALPGFAKLVRGQFLHLAGKDVEAQQALSEARAHDTSHWPGESKRHLQVGAALLSLAIAATSAKADEVDLHLASVEERARELPEHDGLAQLAQEARGLALWAKGDLPRAVAELSKCHPDQVSCRFHLYLAQRKAGDAAGAAATAEKLRARPQRSGLSVWVNRRGLTL
jgi:superkiller protein 3